MCLDDLSDDEVRHRLRFIERHIEQHTQYSKFWWWSWLTVMGGAALGHWGAFAFLPERENPADYRLVRERLFINALGASLMTTQLSVFAMTSAHAKRKLRKMPAGTPGERLERLRYATTLLERSSKRQKMGTTVMAHVAGPLWGVGTGTYLLNRDQPAFFVASAYIMPLIIGEGRVLTQPRAAIRAWEQYRAMACYGRAGYAIPAPPSRDPLDWDLSLGPGAMSFRINF